MRGRERGGGRGLNDKGLRWEDAVGEEFAGGGGRNENVLAEDHTYVLSLKVAAAEAYITGLGKIFRK